MGTYFPTYKKGYLFGADGKLYKVKDDIYKEYMRSVWREIATIKRERMSAEDKRNTTSSGNSFSFPKVVSYESVTDAHAEQILPKCNSAEEEAVRNIHKSTIFQSLHKAIEVLNSSESLIIQKLIIEEMSCRDFAKAYGIPRTTVQYQKKKILSKMRTYIEEDVVGFSKDMVHEALYDER